MQAIIASKVPINQWLRAQSAQILPLSLTMEDANMHSADAKEAQRAFAGEARAELHRAVERRHSRRRPAERVAAVPLPVPAGWWRVPVRTLRLRALRRAARPVTTGWICTPWAG